MSVWRSVFSWQFAHHERMSDQQPRAAALAPPKCENGMAPLARR